MIVVSKFEKLYLLRNIFFPIICIGLSILLIDVKMYYKKDADVTFPVTFLLIVGCLVLFYNLNSIYKLILEEKTIIKIYVLSRRKESIPYTSIKSLDKEFIDGSHIYEVGQITPGYYDYKFSLEDDKELIISPSNFKNYKQLITEINLRCGW
ncbi:hypothetical protein [Flavobacterium ajazii]|uniref:hypothetical protein n=1 Tax=Flavobacterium ajazii TaxID=2692318 RepID=UPI0013D7C1A6|nr:hypothetical protein [Flavobacterium ajazii]